MKDYVKSHNVYIDLTHVEKTQRISAYNVKQLKNQDIPFAWVLWKYGTEQNATWRMNHK